jgi:NAD(P)-dependent dehydrogenase (short-subunit alcohol dehydrogenase family)
MITRRYPVIDLKGARVVITGGARAIGLATAHALLAPIAAWRPPPPEASACCHVPSHTSVIEVLRRPVESADRSVLRVNDRAAQRTVFAPGSADDVLWCVWGVTCVHGVLGEGSTIAHPASTHHTVASASISLARPRRQRWPPVARG